MCTAHTYAYAQNRAKIDIFSGKPKLWVVSLSGIFRSGEEEGLAGDGLAGIGAGTGGEEV